jgi:hypothetical protein
MSVHYILEANQQILIAVVVSTVKVSSCTNLLQGQQCFKKRLAKRQWSKRRSTGSISLFVMAMWVSMTIRKHRACTKDYSWQIWRSVGQSTSSSWFRAPFVADDQILNFFEWHFLSSSCRVPSLTRGRVCNFQCNHANWSSNYIVPDGLSASSSWCRAPNGAHNHILISMFDNYILLGIGHPHSHPPWTGWSSPKSKVKVTLV